MSTPLRERPDAPLGTLIFRAGLLPAETIENALEEGVKTGRRLGEILVERNLIKEEDLTRLLAGQKGLPYVSLRERQVEVDAARLLAEDQARLFTALPIGFEDGVPVVAVADPTNDVLNRNIREALGQEARFVVVARSELNDVIGEVFSGAYQPANGAEPELRIAEAPAAEVDTRVPLPDPEPEAEAAYEPEAELETAPETAVVEPEHDIPADAEPVAAAPETVTSAPAPEPAPTSEPAHAYEPEPAAYEPEPAEAESEPPAPAFEAPGPVAEPAYDPTPAYEPMPVYEPEPAVPQPVPVATEPVAPQGAPDSNGRVPEDFEDDTPPPAPASEGAFRVSIRLTSGEKLTVADCADIGEAKGYAKALTKQLGATDSDDWPFVNGRFLKPDTIVSVDVEEI
jgi:Type II secretion system (T2SS), protein E, N-terminal domain